MAPVRGNPTRQGAFWRERAGGGVEMFRDGRQVLSWADERVLQVSEAPLVSVGKGDR